MLSYLLRPLRHLAQSLTGNDSSRQVAWGFTLGMLIGLVPKGNLLAVGLMVLLLGLRVNKPAGLMAAGIFFFVLLSLDGLAHTLGSHALVWEPARPFYTWLYELPLGPWLGTNNTVVVGQLLIGLYLVYPTYWFSKRLAERVQQPLSRWLMRYRVIRWIRGAELGVQWGADA